MVLGALGKSWVQFRILNYNLIIYILQFLFYRCHSERLHSLRLIKYNGQAWFRAGQVGLTPWGLTYFSFTIQFTSTHENLRFSTWVSHFLAVGVPSSWCGKVVVTAKKIWLTGSSTDSDGKETIILTSAFYTFEFSVTEAGRNFHIP